MRSWLVRPLVVFSWLCLTPAAAQPQAPISSDDAAEADPASELGEQTQRCLTAFNDGQRLRREGRLRSSHDEFLICAQPTCPSLLTDKCVPWLGEVERAIPTVVVVAKGPQGRDTVAVRLAIDGVIVAEQLDGRPIAVDPGPHEFRFDTPRALAIVQQLVIVEGEKGRRIDLQFQSAEAPPTVTPNPLEPPPQQTADTTSTTLPPWFWVGVSLAGVGVAVGAITGVMAINQADDLNDNCGQDKRCPSNLEQDYDEGVVLAHVSTAGFVLAGAGAALAVGSWLLADGDAGAQTAIRLGPMSATVTGSF